MCISTFKNRYAQVDICCTLGVYKLICISCTSYKKTSVMGLQVTLLVATSVAEEGLDIRQCNVVIRFDLAKTVLAYIQSRGRARKPGSDYILMLER